MILTGYDSTNGDAATIFLDGRIDSTQIKNTSNVNISIYLGKSGIAISNSSNLDSLVGSDFVDLLLLACDTPLFNSYDREVF